MQVSLFVSRSGGAWLKVAMLPPDMFLAHSESSSGNVGTRERIIGELPVFRNPDGRLSEPRPNSPFVFSHPDVYNNARLSKSLSNEEPTALAREWLRQCNERHRKYSLAVALARPGHGYPTRLIDVGNGQEKSLQIRLVITKELRTEPEYLTLSHCWGNAEIMKLFLGNIDGFKCHIPFDRLPQTFQDAIKITRQLGHRYIWIDSLCIIQDSKEQSDWRAESKIMGDIYEKSVCTIAALTGRSSSEGCFAEGSDHDE